MRLVVLLQLERLFLESPVLASESGANPHFHYSLVNCDDFIPATMTCDKITSSIALSDFAFLTWMSPQPILNICVRQWGESSLDYHHVLPKVIFAFQNIATTVFEKPRGSILQVIICCSRRTQVIQRSRRTQVIQRMSLTCHMLKATGTPHSEVFVK